MPAPRKKALIAAIADADPFAIASARRAGLIYVSADQPGISRRKAGKGFSYLDANGKKIANKDELQRLRSLAVPPAYTDVWICGEPQGHLQATGRDARLRKQYRYHPEWRSSRDTGKFGRLAEFGAALPALRRRLKRDLDLPGLPEAKVLATVISLLEETLVRVGNTQYARDNHSYGLTTLRSRHAAIKRGGRISFRFRGKGGIDHDVSIADARLARIVRQCQQLPGQSLFQYFDEDGDHRPVDSGMVNEYLHEAMGESFTAKDFRTWGGTLRAIAALARTPIPEDGSDREVSGILAEVVRSVASELRNTPAVCRKSYIDPRVFEAWQDGYLQRLLPPSGRLAPRQLEAMALRLLKRKARLAK